MIKINSSVYNYCKITVKCFRPIVSAEAEKKSVEFKENQKDIKRTAFNKKGSSPRWTLDSQAFNEHINLTVYVAPEYLKT